jgi:hypothetical protein
MAIICTHIFGESVYRPALPVKWKANTNANEIIVLLQPDHCSHYYISIALCLYKLLKFFINFTAVITGERHHQNCAWYNNSWNYKIRFFLKAVVLSYQLLNLKSVTHGGLRCKK